MLTLKTFCILLLLASISCENILIQKGVYKDFANKIEEFLKDVSTNNISSICKTQMEEYKNGLLSKQMWALKMFDYGSKIPSGLLEGNFVDLGFYDQCLNIEEDVNSIHISGKYCLGKLPININFNSSTPLLFKHSNILNWVNIKRANTSIRLQVATCTPNACDAKELGIFYQKVFPSMVFNENECQTKNGQPVLNGGSIAFT
ncbi:hypothetical protein ILUMI_16163, partial [Ignelater luminosus]